MPVATFRTKKRNADMYSDYKNIYKEKAIKTDQLIKMLADKYYLQENTVQKIILSEAKRNK